MKYNNMLVYNEIMYNVNIKFEKINKVHDCVPVSETKNNKI